MGKTLLILIFLLTVTRLFSQGSADQSIADKLDEYLKSANAVYKFNGTALVAKGGVILLHKGYGRRNMISRSLNDSNTLFQIGSMTKSFTSIVILKLVEEGKLSLDDRLSKFIPGYPNGKDISIRNLLTHTSGIHNYTDDIDESDSAIICCPVTRERVLDQFMNKKPEFKPGKKFEYNNSGYFLLGMIIEKITGKQYERVVREMIFDPLQMDHSGFDFKNRVDTNKAQGYVILRKDNSRASHSIDSTVYFSAGGIYSSTADLYKWARAIEQHKILNDSSWARAFTPNMEKYGYGFLVDSIYGRSYVRHSGGLLGFTSDFLYFPTEKLTIILLNNVGDYGNSLYPTAAGIASIVFDQPYKNWEQPAVINVSEVTLRKYAGAYKYNADHSMIVTFENGNLFVRASNPKDMLPKVRLFASKENMFYIKEAQLSFEFVNDDQNNPVKLVTYNTNGKDAEWLRVK